MAMSVEETQTELPVVETRLGPIGRLKHFIHEVRLEMKKVSWPTRQEVINTTIVVIVAVFFFGFFLFATDIGLTYLIEGIEWVARKIF